MLSEIELESAYQRAREEEYDRSSKLSHDGSYTAGDSADEGRPVQVALPVGTDSSNPGGNDGADRSREAIVWILDENNLLHPVIVTLGLLDGAFTQILSGGLRQADKVITGLEVTSSSSATRSGTPAPGLAGPPPPPPS